MTKQTYVKVAGVWKPCTSIWTKAGGVWKQNVMPHVRVGGVYKECMEYSPPQDFSPIHGNEFIWNGFTYKVIVKDYGGGVVYAWLDRNLGASRVPTASNDSLSYGYLYQYGRIEDGHQIRTSGTTSNYSTTDIPGHGDFIYGYTNWLSPWNSALWDGVNGLNSPCPPGWRIPTHAELSTESNSWSTVGTVGAYGSNLKFPLGGYRNNSNAALTVVGSHTLIWYSGGGMLYVENGFHGFYSTYKARGYSVRCIRTDV